MAIKIRLARGGRKKLAKFRIVVADTRCARDGRYLEKLGFYDPQATPKTFTIDVERAKYWIEKGAEVSQTVADLFKQDRLEEKMAAIAAGTDIAAIARKPEAPVRKKKNNNA